MANSPNCLLKRKVVPRRSTHFCKFSNRRSTRSRHLRPQRQLLALNPKRLSQVTSEFSSRIFISIGSQETGSPSAQRPVSAAPPPPVKASGRKNKEDDKPKGVDLAPSQWTDDILKETHRYNGTTFVDLRKNDKNKHLVLDRRGLEISRSQRQ